MSYTDVRFPRHSGYMYVNRVLIKDSWKACKACLYIGDMTLFDRDELRLMSQKEILEFRVELQAGLKELDSYIDKREKTGIFSASEAQPTPSQPSPAPREP